MSTTAAMRIQVLLSLRFAKVVGSGVLVQYQGNRESAVGHVHKQ